MVLRGVSLVTATTVAAEIGDFQRFPTANQFMAYLGLIPSEHSSGATRRQGGITRTGNRRVRCLLVEAATHYRHLPNLSPALRRRNEGVADGVRQIAWRAQHRLHQRLGRLKLRGKSPQKAVVAVAEGTGRIHLGDWTRTGARSSVRSALENQRMRFKNKGNF